MGRIATRFWYFAMFDRPLFVICMSFVCLLVVFLSSVRGKKPKFCKPFGTFGRPLSNIPLLPGGTRPDFFEPISRFVGRVLAPKGRPACRTVPRPFESGGDPRALLCLFLLVGVCFVVSGYHTETQKASFHYQGTPYGLPPC